VFRKLYSESKELKSNRYIMSNSFKWNHSQFFILIFICILLAVHPATSFSSVYDNIENCEPGWSGHRCQIPYENCKDSPRKCFNDSKCVRSSFFKDNHGDYSYTCDCSIPRSITRFAGRECEYAFTEYCDEDKELFCTNGGTCGSYVIEGHHYVGCHCPSGHMGAHCQYLKNWHKGGMPGQALVPEIGENFYTKTIPKDTENSHNHHHHILIWEIFFIIISCIFLFMLSVMILMIISFLRKRKEVMQMQAKLVALPRG